MHTPFQQMCLSLITLKLRGSQNTSRDRPKDNDDEPECDKLHTLLYYVILLESIIIYMYILHLMPAALFKRKQHHD